LIAARCCEACLWDVALRMRNRNAARYGRMLELNMTSFSGYLAPARRHQGRDNPLGCA